MLLLLICSFALAAWEQAPAAPPEQSGVQTNAPAPISPAGVTQAMGRVAGWQIAHPGRHSTQDWTQGALYAGMAAWAQLADDPVYLRTLYAIGETNAWQPGKRVYHADDHCVGQMYIDLYNIYGEAKMLAGIRARLDEVIAAPAKNSLKFGSPRCTDRWSWCDALFMSPTVLTKLYAATGEKKYLEFMDREFWATAEYLYDRQENLFYRDDRFFTQREKNGRKVFWSRGNGWVFAGLCVILQDLPAGHPSRSRYETLFREMAARLKSIQCDDGYWRASLLDPGSCPNPETSGTGFFTYGLAWGINSGLLDRAEYAPAARRGWAALEQAVMPDGKLGWVQPIGADPRATERDHSDVYGVGAFLLAGCEVYKLTVCNGAPPAPVTVRNPAGLAAVNRVVSLDLNRLRRPEKDLLVLDARTGRALLHQVADAAETGGARRLLVQCSVGAKRARTLWILNSAAVKAAQDSALCTGRHVPERKDDFAWENDRIAFRVYGPALQAAGEVSSGIDVWVKKVRYPVIDKWYRLGKIHTDQGEGLDAFEMGPTRGCGGLGFLCNSELAVSRNWATQRLICAGPLRVSFELTYAPWKVGACEVAEVKRITLDRGSNLNLIESRFTMHGTNRLTAAIGIVKQGKGGQASYSAADGWCGYWEPDDPLHGAIACGVVVPGRPVAYLDALGHCLLTTDVREGETLRYYAGAGWSRSGDFNAPAAWFDYLRGESLSLAPELQIHY